MTLDRLDVELTVIGFTQGQSTFGHIDVAYLPVDTWRLTAAGLSEPGALTAGVAAGVGMGAAMPAAMPVDLELEPIAVASGLTILLGMLGAAIAVLRITRIDPLRALGGQR